MTEVNLKVAIIETLEDIKAINITPLNVADITTVTDYMIIVTGSSSTHLRAIAEKIVEKSKQLHHNPLGIEGQDDAKWILVDLGNIVIHVMLAETRDYYQLDKLWQPMLEEEAMAIG